MGSIKKLFKLNIHNAGPDEIEALIYIADKPTDVQYLYIPDSSFTFEDYIARHQLTSEDFKIEEIGEIRCLYNKILLDSWL